ncbi:hypothetical protein [Streptomyces sp. NPDC019507]|uniref:hypothetical protein n=1 Tax=Streptomyces sp. NPDC019507 TaxID=3154689 RepID=UPI0033EA223D
MHIPKKAALLLAPSLTLAVLGLDSPAFAVDSEPSRTDTPVATAAPAEPEETLTEGAPESEAPAPLEPAGKPPVDNGAWARPCEPGWKYFATSKGKDYHKGVGAEQSNYNGTSQTARSTFTSEVTGEVGIAYTGELKVSGGVAVAEIEGSFGVEVSAKLTAKLGNTISVNTPPRKTTHARYGVYRLKSLGYNHYVYANCTKGVKKNVTIYTPRRIGWAIWEG